MSRLARMASAALVVALASPGVARAGPASSQPHDYLVGLEHHAAQYPGYSFVTVRHGIVEVGFVGPLPPPIRQRAGHPPAGLTVRVYRAEFTDDAMAAAVRHAFRVNRRVEGWGMLGRGHGVVFTSRDATLLRSTHPADLLGVHVGVVVVPARPPQPPTPRVGGRGDVDSYRARLRRATIAHPSWSYFTARAGGRIRLGFVGPVPADVRRLLVAAPAGVDVRAIRAPYSHRQLQRTIEAILRSHFDCSAAHPIGRGQGVAALCLNDRLYRSANPRSLLHVGVGVIVRHGISGPPGLRDQVRRPAQVHA